ncbi:MAG: transglutaminase-like domain-containing protein [Phycisphaerales bacterium]|nr:transglutaminase-like domain-containing protein [Phycisphaerales bacterium]
MFIAFIASLIVGLQAAPAAPTDIPQYALQRVSPRIWWFSFNVVIRELDVPNNDRPFRMPLITNGPWSELGPHTLRVESLSGNKSNMVLNANQALMGTGVQGEQMVRMPVDVTAQNFAAIDVSAEVVCWGSEVNEDAAASIPWPAQWPAGVAKALQPQVLIESDEPIFKQTVDSIFGPNLRMTPPWIAAKRITQYCCNNITISGNRLVGTRSNALRGLNVAGALATAQSGKGTRADLVCLSVAMLRAAGIPARPVVGLSQVSGKSREPVAWAEFYLPRSGWVPFSPWEMQKAGVRTWKPDREWRYFGNWKDLNLNIPLAWSFAPGDGTTAYDTWAIWGWTRAMPWAPFPAPVKVMTLPNRPETMTRDYRPAAITLGMSSGSSISDRDLTQWREGERRPIRRPRP